MGPADRPVQGSILCSGDSLDSPAWNAAVEDLYAALARGYAVIDLAQQQAAAIGACQRTFQNVLAQGTLVRGFANDRGDRYHHLPDKQLYETELRGRSYSNSTRHGWVKDVSLLAGCQSLLKVLVKPACLSIGFPCVMPTSRLSLSLEQSMLRTPASVWPDN